MKAGILLMAGGGAILAGGYVLEKVTLPVLAWIPASIQAAGLFTVVVGAAMVADEARAVGSPFVTSR